MLVEMQKALGEGKLGWTNAKKAALQYGFSNLGVEEQRPTFEEYVKHRYEGLDVNTLPLEVVKTLHGYYFSGFFRQFSR